MTLLLLFAGTGAATPAPSTTQANRLYYADLYQTYTADPTHTHGTDTEGAQMADPTHTHGATGRRTEDA